MKKKIETSSFSPFKNYFFWFIIVICLAFLAFKPGLFLYELTIFKYTGPQQTFKKQCEALNDADFTLENILTLQGQCREVRGMGITGYSPCTQEHIPTQQELDSGHGIVVASNFTAAGWHCTIKSDQGRMKTETNWYWD